MAVVVVMAGGRVYIAAHYPQAVLAGLTLGAFIAVAGYWVAHRPLTSLVRRLPDTRLRPLVTAAPPADSRPGCGHQRLRPLRGRARKFALGDLPPHDDCPYKDHELCPDHHH